MLQCTHMPSFIRQPGGLRDHPALVLNADYRPLSYLPLSLWPWQEAVKAAFLDRVVVVAEYDAIVRSPSLEIRIPSVVVLKDYVKRGRLRCTSCGLPRISRLSTVVRGKVNAKGQVGQHPLPDPVALHDP